MSDSDFKNKLMNQLKKLKMKLALKSSLKRNVVGLKTGRVPSKPLPLQDDARGLLIRVKFLSINYDASEEEIEKAIEMYSKLIDTQLDVVVREKEVLRLLHVPRQSLLIHKEVGLLRLYRISKYDKQPSYSWSQVRELFLTSESKSDEDNGDEI